MSVCAPCRVISQRLPSRARTPQIPAPKSLVKNAQSRDADCQSSDVNRSHRGTWLPVGHTQLNSHRPQQWRHHPPRVLKQAWGGAVGLGGDIAHLPWHWEGVGQPNRADSCESRLCPNPHTLPVQATVLASSARLVVAKREQWHYSAQGSRCACTSTSKSGHSAAPCPRGPANGDMLYTCPALGPCRPR